MEATERAELADPAEAASLRPVFTLMELLLDATDEHVLFDGLLPALREAIRADSVRWAMRAAGEAPGAVSTLGPVLSADGARRRLRLTFPAGGGRSVCVTCIRAARDFTPAERELAENLGVLLGKAVIRLAPPPPPSGVTRREAQVLALLGDGLADQQIAHRLGISPRTVGKHLEHIYAKLGERGRLRTVTHWRASRPAQPAARGPVAS